MREILKTFLGVTGLILLAACGHDQAPEEDVVGAARPPEGNDASTPLSIYTVNYPLQFFAERIGGDWVEVVFPAPPGEDPAYWRPTTKEIAAYQDADLILLNGAGYAKWLSLVSLPQTKLVDTSAVFREDYLPLEEGPVHTHGPQGEHSHKGTAFTTWLDPGLAIEQARAVLDALSEKRPEHEEDFGKRFAELEAELQGISSELELWAIAQQDRPLLFSHPLYQYLIRRYDLNARSVHWEPGQMPSDQQWQELDELLLEHPARWMIWEEAPSTDVIARLEERNVESVVFRPSANTPEAGDYIAAMKKNLDEMKSMAP